MEKKKKKKKEKEKEKKKKKKEKEKEKKKTEKEKKTENKHYLCRRSCNNNIRPCTHTLQISLCAHKVNFAKHSLHLPHKPPLGLPILIPHSHSRNRTKQRKKPDRSHLALLPCSDYSYYFSVFFCEKCRCDTVNGSYADIGA